MPHPLTISSTYGSLLKSLHNTNLYQVVLATLTLAFHEEGNDHDLSCRLNGTCSTTNAQVPHLFRSLLQTKAEIKEDATTFMGAAAAVEALEKEVGWDPEISNFLNRTPLASLSNGIGGVLYSPARNRIKAIELGKPLHELMDIVVPSIRDLDFLEEWKPFIEKFHIIIIQDGDPSKVLKIPSWANYELYNRHDIESALGDRAWVISSHDASIRNFGFLVSDKKLIYTLDDDCLPAKDHEGKLVDAITMHAVNLLTPSTPYFFNTIYDPYRPGSDFVRGYPYSRRGGVPTAVSHGLWMNAYDYDAPTQLLKITERNTRYIDATLTIPHKVLYPMCSMNVAFDRNAIGPAFMQGLMGDGQPWARYDDMFCGWASKVVGDHIGVGTKSGAPYIHHNKASNPFTNLKKEYKGLTWQEDAIAFFESVQLSSESNTASLAYLELADKVIEHLKPLNEYFERLGKAMKIWVQLWDERFGGKFTGVDCYSPTSVDNFDKCIIGLLPVASKSSIGPSSADSTCAIFTIVHDENVFLPIWIRYYSRHVPLEDIWILDHQTTDGSTDLNKIPRGIHHKRVHGDSAWMPHYFINRVVDMHMQRLLRAGYKCVMFIEVDEIIIPDANTYPNGLKQYFTNFINSEAKTIRSTGFVAVHISQGTEHIEPPIDWTKDLMKQRSYYVSDPMFNKPVLSKVPLRYTPGHHDAGSKHDIIQDSKLVLWHIHGIDYEYCVEREKKKYEGAVAAGHREEAGLGMISRIGSEFDSILRQTNVCGEAMSQFRDGGFYTGYNTATIAILPSEYTSTIV